MVTKTQPTQGSNLDDVLKETELGKIISSYKTPLAIIIGLIVLSVLGWGIYRYQKDQKSAGHLNKLYTFEQKNMEAFEKGEIGAADLVSNFKTVSQEVNFFDGAVPLAMIISDMLSQKGETAHAASVLEDYWKNYQDSNSYLTYLLGRRMSVIYENNAQDEQAIRVLEKLNKRGIKFLEDTLYLDLGRLSLKLGDKETAKRNFEHVVDNGKDKDLQRQAKLYLERL